MRSFFSVLCIISAFELHPLLTLTLTLDVLANNNLHFSCKFFHRECLHHGFRPLEGNGRYGRLIVVPDKLNRTTTLERVVQIALGNGCMGWEMLQLVVIRWVGGRYVRSGISTMTV